LGFAVQRTVKATGIQIYFHTQSIFTLTPKAILSGRNKVRRESQHTRGETQLSDGDMYWQAIFANRHNTEHRPLTTKKPDRGSEPIRLRWRGYAGKNGGIL
jgi:hypothetical protein